MGEDAEWTVAVRCKSSVVDRNVNQPNNSERNRESDALREEPHGAWAATLGRNYLVLFRKQNKARGSMKMRRRNTLGSCSTNRTARLESVPRTISPALHYP